MKEILINWSIFVAWAMLTAYSYLFVLKNHHVIKEKLLLLVFPTVALIVFAIVFVFNNGSSVAQLSGSRKLWSLWFDFYIPLAIGNIINLVTAVILFLINFIKKAPRTVVFFHFQILIITLFTLYHILPNMPDA